MNYYARHVGDYIRDTAHLTLLEHGVYTRLLDVYYTREAPIPADQANRLVGARSREEKEAVASVLAEFFTLADGAWRNKRCDEELEKHAAFLANQKRKGEASGKARRLRSGTRVDEPETNSGSTGDEQRFRSGSTRDEPESNLPSPISHLPSPKPESLSQQSERSHSESPSARVRETGASEAEKRSELTPAVRACILLRDGGHNAANPSHPGLLAAVNDGLTPEELRAVADEFPSKPFAYWLKTAEGRRRDASATRSAPVEQPVQRWTPPDDDPEYTRASA